MGEKAETHSPFAPSPRRPLNFSTRGLMKIIDSREKDIATELKRIVNRGETATEEVAAIVKEVVGRVRKEGDPAVIEYTEKFDKVKLTLKDIRVSPEEIKASYDRVEPQKVEALKLAAQNIRAF